METLSRFSPVIVLPERLLQSGPSEELTTALCHEMAHVRRRDCLVNLICEFALLPLVFHPAAWLLRRRIPVPAPPSGYARGQLVEACEGTKSLSLNPHRFAQQSIAAWL